MRAQPAAPSRGLSNLDSSAAFCQQRQNNEPTAEQKEMTDERVYEMDDEFHKFPLELHKKL